MSNKALPWLIGGALMLLAMKGRGAPIFQHPSATWTIPERGRKYAKLFEAAERKYNLPKNLLAVIAQTESDYNPAAVGRDGEKGMMQIFTRWHPDPNITKNPVNWLDPAEAVNYAGAYLQYLHKKTGNWFDAVRAYNGGIGNILALQQGKPLLTKNPSLWLTNVNRYAKKAAQAVNYNAPKYWS